MVSQKKINSAKKQKATEMKGPQKMPPKMFSAEVSDDDDDDDIDMDSDDSGDSGDSDKPTVEKTPSSNLKTPQTKSAKKGMHVSFQVQNDKTPSSPAKMPKPRQDTPMAKKNQLTPFAPASGKKNKMQEFQGMKEKVDPGSANKSKNQVTGKKIVGGKKQISMEEEDDDDDDDDSDDFDSDSMDDIDPVDALKLLKAQSALGKSKKTPQKGKQLADDDDDSDEEGLKKILGTMIGENFKAIPKVKQQQKTPSKTMQVEEDDSDDDEEDSDDDIQNALQSMKAGAPAKKGAQMGQQSPTKGQKQTASTGKPQNTQKSINKQEESDDDEEDSEDDDDSDDKLGDDIQAALQVVRGKHSMQAGGKSPAVGLDGKAKKGQPGGQAQATPQRANVQNKLSNTPGQKSTQQQQSPIKTSAELPRGAMDIELQRKRERDIRNLYVKGLPIDVTVAELKSLSPDILDVTLPKGKMQKRNKRTGRPLFAFLEFANEKKAEENYTFLQNKKLRGQPLTVDFSGAKSKNKHISEMSVKQDSTKSYNMKKLFLSGMSTVTNISQIAALYPNSISIVINRAEEYRTAAVLFQTEEEAAKALKASEKLRLDGRLVTVLQALEMSKKAKKRKSSHQKQTLLSPPAKRMKTESGRPTPKGNQQQKQSFGGPPAKRFQQQVKQESEDSDDDDTDES